MEQMLVAGQANETTFLQEIDKWGSAQLKAALDVKLGLESGCGGSLSRHDNYRFINNGWPGDMLAGVKVLLVDDEPDMLVTTELMLIFYEAEVVSVTSAIEALSQVQLLRPDVIVSDIGRGGPVQLDRISVSLSDISAGF